MNIDSLEISDSAPRPTDSIELHNMAFFAHHGVHEEENRLGQRFFVTLRVHVDLRRAGELDYVRETINYADLHAIALAMQGEPGTRPEPGQRREVQISGGRTIKVPLGPFRLLETLGHNLALEILRHFPETTGVEVDIRKPSVPIAGILDHATIRIRRDRRDLSESGG